MPADHLNTFRGFLSKDDTEEDHLTRALLVLMRLVPEAHALFLEQVLHRRGEKKPPLPIRKIAARAKWRTQTGSVADTGSRLLSIVIAKDIPDYEIPVVRGDRTARYDGVISYEDGWVFVIEVKTHRRAISISQASPAASSVAHLPNDALENPAVVIAWPDLIRTLAALSRDRTLGSSSQLLVEDFLAYAHDLFPLLNPFDRLSMCRDSDDLLDERCREILATIGPGRVEYHQGWHHFLRFEHGAAHQVALFAERLGGPTFITLQLNPGDTKDQSKHLYPHLNIERLLRLRRHGWTIEPNLHFNFRTSGLVHATTSMPLEKYLDVAVGDKIPSGGCPIKGSPTIETGFAALLGVMESMHLMTAADVEEVHVKFTRTARPSININPGIEMKFRWSLGRAGTLDDRGEFVGAVRTRIHEAFATWKQHDPILETGDLATGRRASPSPSR